jgi:acetyl-CoA carboxylase biotin carboxyl carrier protein
VSLTAADVAEIMRLVEQSTFDELTLEMEGIKLSLRRGAPIVGVPGKVAAAGSEAPSSGGPGTPPSPRTEGATAVPEASSAPRPDPIASAAAVGSSLRPPGTARKSAADAVGSPPSPRGAAAAASTAGSGGPATAGSRPPQTNTVAAPADPDVHEVASPLLGTFYRAPKPGAPPYVEVGAQVDEGTVVAIIEVMKLMNTVRAGVRGTVTEILVADGALAEYGETLMRVRKAG